MELPRIRTCTRTLTVTFWHVSTVKHNIFLYAVMLGLRLDKAWQYLLHPPSMPPSLALLYQLFHKGLKPAHGSSSKANPFWYSPSCVPRWRAGVALVVYTVL